MPQATSVIDYVYCSKELFSTAFSLIIKEDIIGT